MHRNFSRNQET